MGFLYIFRGFAAYFVFFGGISVELVRLAGLPFMGWWVVRG